MVSFPNAKINLGLDIIEKRNDGYHNISSCFYPIKLTDVLEIIESNKFSFSSTGFTIPGQSKENLVIKAYQLLKKDFDLPEVAIHLHKSIPTGAGLGGGSADGAYTLKMLNTLFELYLDDTILIDYASTLGSDCPFFIYSLPMIVEGRGDLIRPCGLKLKGYYLFIIKPDFAISTIEAYQEVIPIYPENSIEEILDNPSPETWKDVLKNDFETGLFKKNPELKEIKKQLFKHGALYASLTGSGAAIFGIFREDPVMDAVFPKMYFTWKGKL